MKFHARLALLLVAGCLFLIVMMKKSSLFQINLDWNIGYSLLQSDNELFAIQDLKSPVPYAKASKSATTDELVKNFLYRYDLHWNYSVYDTRTLWKIASDWITVRQIHSEFAPELGEDGVDSLWHFLNTA